MYKRQLDNLLIKIAETPTETTELADLALKNRLYVSGWALSHCLKRCRADSSGTQTIIVAEKNNIPIGVVLCFRDEQNLIMTFVRKNQRRQGVGSTMISTYATEFTAPKLTGISGCERSDRFYTSLNTYCRKEYNW